MSKEDDINRLREFLGITKVSIEVEVPNMQPFVINLQGVVDEKWKMQRLLDDACQKLISHYDFYKAAKTATT